MSKLQGDDTAYTAVTTQPIPNAHGIGLQLDGPSAPPPGGLPSPNTICPPGLEYLIPLDHIFVKQKLHFNIIQQLNGEIRNEYNVVDKTGETIYTLLEESSKWSRCCYGALRDFEMKVFDKSNREVLTMVRPLKCDNCCSLCDAQEMAVYSNGLLMGKIIQEPAAFTSKYFILDHNEQQVLRISASILRMGPPLFKVKSINGNYQVGTIQRNWSGFFSHFEVFGVSFPLDLDVKIKAVLLGACILIDIMFYENRR